MHVKITIIGNSVALRTRPPLQYPDNQNYSQILYSLMASDDAYGSIAIDNRAMGATTTYNVSVNIDSFINSFPNIFIINLGVVDASTREVPLWFYRLASSSKAGFIYFLSKAIYRNILIRFRPFLVRLRGKRSWVSKKKFERNFKQIVHGLSRETNAKIIVMPINIANNRVEKSLPGSRKKHIMYNQVMKKIAETHNHFFIELDELNDVAHYPDGVHFSKKGHEIVSSRLKDVIDTILKK